MAVFFILLTIVVSCLLVYFYTVWKHLKYFEKVGIPYVPGKPIVGNMAPVLLQQLNAGKLMQNLYNMFPDSKYFGMFDCGRPIFVIRDTELIKQIAIKNFDNFTDHYGLSTDADKVFYNALFSLRGDRWRDMRGLLSPAFTSSKLKQTFGLIAKCAKNFAESLEQSTGNGTVEFEMKDFTGKYANDIICKYAFGIEVDSLKNPENEIYNTGKEIFAFDGPLSMRFFLLKNFQWVSRAFQIPLFKKEATDLFTKIIKSTIQERDKHNFKNNDMLQVMINASRTPNFKVKVDLDDIMSQTFIFFFGGYDTTSSYLSNTLYLLVNHPEEMEKLLAEIDEVWDKTNGNPTYEDLQAMPYLECVLAEVGRMLPPVPFIERMCTKTFELPPAMPGMKPVTLNYGDTVYFPCYALQHDPQYFADPEKFMPERFREKPVNYDSGYYMPFGMGRRICIGARLAMIEMKMLIFHLMSRVTFKPSSQNEYPMKLSTTSFIIMLHKKYWLQVEKRKKHLVD